MDRGPGHRSARPPIAAAPRHSRGGKDVYATYYKIYRDPFLSRYAPGGGALWGHRHPFGRGFHPLGPAAFPGMEPVGDYPIHIVVKSGKITLLGVVDSESDKTVAGLRAREVPGAFGVENTLVVEKSEPKSTRR